MTAVAPGPGGHTRAALVVLWLFLVLPGLPLGYGSDGDAWLVAKNAARIWDTGEYSRSRTVGFPLHEIVVAPLVRLGGWHLANGATAAAGLVFLLALFRLAERGGARHPLPFVLGLGFLPLVIANAATTMDYLFALAALAWGQAALFRGRHFLGAGLAGLACGFRPTSGLMLLPAALLVWSETRSGARALAVLAWGAAAGAAAFSPVLLTYGLRNPYGGFEYDPARALLTAGYVGMQALGLVPWIVLAAVMAAELWRRRREMGRVGRSAPPGVVSAGEAAPAAAGYAAPSRLAFHLANVAAFGLLFLLAPDEPEYLLPALLSLLFLADRLAGRRGAALLAAAILSHHVVQIDPLGGVSGRPRPALRLRPGLTLLDLEDRRFKLSVREALTRYHPGRPTLLMLGEPYVPAVNDAWVFDREISASRQRYGRLYLSHPVTDPGRLRELAGRGLRLVAWRGDFGAFRRAPAGAWEERVEVVDDLGRFLGMPIRGRALSDR